MPRPANAVDFWRGLALVTIFVNHIPGLFFERFTHRNFSISDSAELFVFLAGWSLSHVVGKPNSPTPLHRLIFQLEGRALKIYFAHLTIVTIAIAILATASRVLSNPLFLEWHNAASVFYDPIDTHIGIVILSHQLWYFNILPLYIVLSAIAPIITVTHRNLPSWLLPLSLTVYILALVFQISLPNWPGNGQWAFNPVCWQLVFVLGFALSQQEGLGGWVRANLKWVRRVALPIVVGGAIIVRFNWWPDPASVPEPKLLFIAEKAYVTPMRLVQFLALAAIFSATYPWIERASLNLARYFSMLGRNSLQVFCVGSLLSLCGQIIRFYYQGGMALDTLLLLAGLILLWLTAWLNEWRARARDA